MMPPANSGTRRRLAVLFAVPFAFSVLFFVFNVLSARNDTTLLNLQNLSAGISRLRAISGDAAVGEQGFLLTGDEGYLVTLEAANARFKQYAVSLPSGTDAPEAVRRQVGRFVAEVRDRVDEANRIVEMQRSQGATAALELVKSSHSEPKTQEVRLLADQLQAELNRQHSHYLEDERVLTRASFLLFLFGALIMLVVLVWLYNSFLAYMQARDRANEQLQALNLDLERRIAERTRELREFNEELQQFAYVASHDLQEPLRTVTSFTQLLASRYKGRLDEDADEFIGYIVTAAHRMTDLINGLLALLRLRKNRQGVEAVSFGKLVHDAEVSLQAAIRESGARIEAGPLPSLVVDGLQFAQVLQNLISNAIKYRREEPPMIRIAARRDSGSWVFSVEDNGRGFDQQFSERIFGLFQRLHTREVEGTGMGLTIVRKIVERHGGRIWAESAIGAGSRFSFSLPTSLEAHPAEELAAAAGQQAGA